MSGEARMDYYIEEYSDHLKLMAGGREILCEPNVNLSLDVLEVDKDNFSLQGRLLFHGDEKPHLYLESDSREEFPCILQRWKENDRGIYKGWFFQVYVEFGSIHDRARFYFTVHDKGVRHVLADVNVGRRFPIEKTISESYCVINDIICKLMEGCLVLRRSTGSEIDAQEEKFQKQLLSLHDDEAEKAVMLRRLYMDMKPLLKRPIWLISDRNNKADDNGEVFFNYVMSHNVPVDCYFILRKDSSDYVRLSKIGPVIEYLSDNHYFYQLLSDVWISSTASEYVDNPFFESKKYYRDILWSKKYVFLQHGIIKDNLSMWLGKCHKGLDLFITSAHQEYKMILAQNYFYGKDVVKLTGMARYDRLEDKNDKVICIMPTWRQYLGSNETCDRDGIRRYNDSFKESRYFKFYNALLNDEKLLASAKKLGYTIAFMPHPNVVTYIDWFTRSPEVEFCHIDTRYEEILGRSSLLVTDYSSVAHDFSYQYKPVIYCQFDKEEFYKTHTYTKGNVPYDYETHGFGEVEYSLEGTVDRIISYMESDCLLKPLYRERIDSFYGYHDKNSCERIYHEIMKLPIFELKRNHEPEVHKHKWLHLFPVKLFKPGERVLMYGYGDAGKEFYQQNKLYGYANIIAIVDSKISVPTSIDNGMDLLPLSEIGKLEYDSILVAMRFREVAYSAIDYLESIGIEKERIKWDGDEYFHEDLLSHLMQAEQSIIRKEYVKNNDGIHTKGR